MSATNDLFARWKALRGFQSDREAALELGVSHGAPHHWRSGANAQADVIERMALDLKEDPATWAARVMAEQTKGEAARAWARIAKRLAAAVACLVAAAGIMEANSATTAGTNSRTYQVIHYAHSAMRQIRRIFALQVKIWATA